MQELNLGERMALQSNTKEVSFAEATQQIKLSTDIIDVIGRHVALRRAGRNYIGLCPFHSEKSPSFSVSAEKQMFKCFGCGEGGDSLSFLMKIENKSFGELILDLAHEQGIQIEKTGQTRAHTDELDLMHQLNQAAQQFYTQKLQQHSATLDYLYEREISDHWQAKFALGFAPEGWENLVGHLQSQFSVLQHTPTTLEKSGLGNLRSEGQGYYDRFRNRLMIPIHNDKGLVVAFGARALNPEDTPKYLNSPETPLYVKNRILYGYYWAKESIRSKGYAIIMEGYFDVMRAHMSGVTQAVGVCGTALTDMQVKLLTRAGATTLYLCFDHDKAGKTAALRSIELIENQLFDQGLSVTVIQLEGGKDPDDYLKTNSQAAFETRLEQAIDFLSFKFECALEQVPAIQSDEGRVKAVQVVTQILLKIENPVLRQNYIRRLAEQIGISEEVLLAETKRQEKRNETYQNKKNYKTDAILNRDKRYQNSKTISLHETPQSGIKHHHVAREKLLLSYTFVNESGYSAMMQALQETEDLQLRSPSAFKLVEALRSDYRDSEGVSQFETLSQRLQIRFHQEEDIKTLAYLAECIMLSDEHTHIKEALGADLHSAYFQEKLKREIQDVLSTVQHHHRQNELNGLIQEAKLSDDERALQVQQELRDRFKQRLSQDTPRANLRVPQFLNPSDTKQGV
jgi:DNA primase